MMCDVTDVVSQYPDPTELLNVYPDFTVCTAFKSPISPILTCARQMCCFLRMSILISLSATKPGALARTLCAATCEGVPAYTE